MGSGHDLVYCGVQRVVRNEAAEERKALIECRRVSRFVDREALLGGSEPLHDDFSGFIGDVTQHPSEVRQVVELARSDFK